MAEKEERIFITKIHPVCKFREIHETTAGGHTWVDFMCGKSKVKNLECDDKCFEQCEWKELTGISRQEAINLIEKVLEEGWWSGKTFRQLSEAALNALLEGK